MKKILALILALTMTLALAACGGSNQGTDPAADPGGAQTDPGTTPDPGDTGCVGVEDLDSKLHFIDLDDRDSSVLRGVRFSGNRSGSEEFNSKSPATEGIRCIFELNEYVAALPDTDLTSGILVYVLQHREDQKSYETAQFSEEMPGFTTLYAMEQREGDDWGEFYVNPGDAESGYYDFVFVCEGKAIATLLTRFYAEGELEGRSDAELSALMGW